MTTKDLQSVIDHGEREDPSLEIGTREFLSDLPYDATLVRDLRRVEYGRSRL